MERLTLDNAAFEQAEGKPGVVLPLSEEVTEITGLEPGDEYEVSVLETGGGNIEIEVTFPNLDLTDEQKTELQNALQ